VATYLDREQIRHRLAIQRRYDADQRRMAAAIVLLLLRFGRLDNARLLLMAKAAIWAEVLRPYFIGLSEPFNQDRPQSPYAQLLRDGVEGSIRIQVQRQQGLLRRYIKDEAVLAWLLMFGPSISLPPVRQKTYQEPFWAYADANGLRLNDRIQRNALDVRIRVYSLLDYHARQGDSLEVTGKALTNYMTISGRATNKPYGDYGSYAPWRLLRSEMLVATARATVIASLLNPVVDSVQWRLSPTHRDLDECDFNANGGRNGDGVYPANNAPAYPNHPNERCSLVPVASAPDNINTSNLRGVFNLAGLTLALMTQPAGERETA